MNMEGTLQSPDPYQETIPLISDVTYATDDLLQKASLGLVLGMSYITICVSFRSIGTNKIVNRKERSQRVCSPIYPDADVAVNRFLGETGPNSVIIQQLNEFRCSLSPDDVTLHDRAALNTLVARIFAISTENKNQFSQTYHARLTTRPIAFSGISCIEAQPNDIAYEKGRPA